MKLLPRPISSSLGSKYVMAVTGLLLTGFVLVHMSGNLLIYAGPDALNSYAHKLKEHPTLLWSARLGLLFVFVVHLIYAVRLRYHNAKARPVRYEYEDTLQASWASRHMMLTGLVLLAFTLYHLAHFTLGVVKRSDIQVVNGEVKRLSEAGLPGEKTRNYLDLIEVQTPGSKGYVAAPRRHPGSKEEMSMPPTGSEVRQDVYSMVVAGFRNPFVSASYIVAMVFLGLHLWHGGSSWLQSLGVNSPHYNKLLGALGPVLAVVLVAGNCSIPIYVLTQFGMQL